MKPGLDFADDRQDGSRRAALALHALRETDRAWILQRLPTVQRERLADLLVELKMLGIPASPALVEQMLAATSQANSVRATSDALARQLDAVARLDAALVARLFQGEPAGLIAQILDMRHWPWQDALLEQLGLVKRRRVEEVLDGLRRRLRPKAPEALNRSLVAALLARAQAEQKASDSGATPPAPSTSPWRRRWSEALLRRTRARA